MSQSGILNDLNNITPPGLIVETLTGNSGGAVGPTANNINVRGDGVTVTVVGTPGTSTLTISTIGGGTVTTVNGTTNQITSTNPGGPIVTLSIPSAFIAPGSIASTTTLTAGNLSTAGIVYNTVTSGLLTSHQTTNHNIQVGNSSGQLADIAPSATSGVPLISQGAAADPAFGIAVVAGGGTGVATLTTAYGVLTAGTTATGPVQTLSSLGAAGTVLTSNGAGALPSFQAASGGVTTITGTLNQILPVGPSTGAVTLSISPTLVAPGSIEASTTIKATSGYITTTNGGITVGTTLASSSAFPIQFDKSRSGGIITSGDDLGEIAWSGHDGVGYIVGSRITSTNSGTVGVNRIASDLKFYTHPDSTAAATLRMTIAPTGTITVAAPDSGNTLTLSAFGNGVVLSSSSGVLSSLNTGAANTVLVSSGVGSVPTWAAVPATAGVTAIAGTANQWSVSASTGSVIGSIPSVFISPGSIASTTSITAGNLTTAGIVYNTVTSGLLTSHQTTNHYVQVGNSTGQLTDVAPSATSGVPLISQGASSDPAFGTAVVAGGGTGNTTFTAYSVIAAGTTATGAFQNVVGVGSLNQVLVSQGAGALPVWAAVPATAGVTAIAGTANQWSVSASTGSVTGSLPATLIAPGTIASTTTLAAGTNLLLPTTSSTAGQILWNTGTNGRIHTFGTDNFFAGKSAGNFTTSGTGKNTGVGSQCLPLIGAGTDNTGMGYGALNQVASASFNTAFGSEALESCTTNGNTGVGYQVGFTLPGVNNVCIGYQALKQATSSTATYNVVIGYQAGFNYTTSAPSHNILLNNAGTAAESNKLRIGSGTGTGTQQLNAAFICGVYNTAVGATAGVALVDSTDQVGGLNGASGTVLVGGTKPAFTALNTLAITGINGTTNQITASAPVAGVVTLSLPSTLIAPGTIASTTTNAAGTNFILPVTSSSAGQIIQNSVAIFHTYGTNNTFTGSAGSGNFTLTTGSALANSAYGANSMVALTTGSVNNAFGKDALKAITTSSNNCAFGNSSMEALTTGSGHNTGFGNQTMSSLATGAYNAAFGFTAGNNLTTSDSSNIMVMNDGTAGDNNTIRIGTQGSGNGQQTTCYIAGIAGTTVTSTAAVLVNTTTGQLGTVISSRRYKQDIEAITESPVLDFEPVTFRYIDQPSELHYGLIAEDVAEIMPNMVTYKDHLPETVRYHELPILLLAEIKRLHKRLAVLEAKLANRGQGRGNVI